MTAGRPSAPVHDPKMFSRSPALAVRRLHTTQRCDAVRQGSCAFGGASGTPDEHVAVWPTQRVNDCVHLAIHGRVARRVKGKAHFHGRGSCSVVGTLQRVEESSQAFGPVPREDDDEQGLAAASTHDPARDACAPRLRQHGALVGMRDDTKKKPTRDKWILQRL